MSDEGLELYIKKFLRYLEIERGVSVHTLRAYEQDLSDFREYCNTSPEKIDMIEIRGFVSDRMMKGKEKSTVARKIATLRSFFRYLYQEGYVKINQAKLVPAPKAAKHLPNFLSVDDTFSLVQTPEGIGLLPVRDRAILELLYSSGLRVSEVAGLNVDDLNLREGLVKARGKGKKERMVPIGNKAVDALKSYLIERMLFRKKKTLPDRDAAFFLNRNGGRLTDRQIRRIVVKYARAMGINGQTSVAPMRGCSPLCLLMSISSPAFFIALNAASITASGFPTKVTTVLSREPQFYA
ncbi:MAG: tyrosine-type recombinase/integrase [Nitrospirae bacterium]|nr:tyrosine-type recombinase/integrase [Nitrospirota bacterium]